MAGPSLALARTPSLRPALGRPPGGWLRLAGFAFAALAVAGLAYAAARETSAFALRSVELEGVSGPVAQQVRKAVAPLEGESLVALDPSDVEARVRAVPTVREASVDRAFPHTLAIHVEPERPLAVVQLGTRAWLVAESGRIVRTLAPDARPKLPRIRATPAERPTVGATLSGPAAEAALGVLALVPKGFPERVLHAEGPASDLVLVLVSRLEIRLGEPVNLERKLAAAAAVLRAVPPEERALFDYLDASVPVRVVAGSNSQPSSEGSEFASEVPAN